MKCPRIHKREWHDKLLDVEEQEKVIGKRDFIKTSLKKGEIDIISKDTKDTGLIKYDLELVKYHDHVRVKIKSGKSFINEQL